MSQIQMHQQEVGNKISNASEIQEDFEKSRCKQCSINPDIK